MEGHDLISWNPMMHGYAQHGNGREALHLWDAMNYATYVWHVQLLMVDDGPSILKLTVHEHCMLPCVEQNACMVDMDGGAGTLAKAKRFMDGMHVVCSYGGHSWGNAIFMGI
ncbi:hypothetical protein AMTRI_Chr10g226970 [Amborella trichopoda]|uniref:Pentatricopeptide repeat-containing protein n=1 Tax=Amborella trichopoda TaxID=13333 RepID=U5DBJ2_AMBTC|nr:hypothetical protein AMTR_s00047p00138360 [Amborella trichopoda]